MKKLLLLFLVLIVSGCTSAQGRFIKEMAHAGCEFKSYKANTTGEVAVECYENDKL